MDIAVKLHDTSDVTEVLPFIEEIGLQECTPYSTLNLIFGNIAVHRIHMYDAIHRQLSQVPGVKAIETAVIKQADRDDV